MADVAGSVSDPHWARLLPQILISRRDRLVELGQATPTDAAVPVEAEVVTGVGPVWPVVEVGLSVGGAGLAGSVVVPEPVVGLLDGEAPFVVRVAGEVDPDGVAAEIRQSGWRSGQPVLLLADDAGVASAGSVAALYSGLNASPQRTAFSRASSPPSVRSSASCSRSVQVRINSRTMRSSGKVRP